MPPGQPGAARTQPGAVRNHQEPPGVARSRQKLPGASRSAARSRARRAARSRQEAPGATRSNQKFQIDETMQLSYVGDQGQLGRPRYSSTLIAKGLGFRVLLSYYVAEEGERSRVQPSFAGGRA